MPETRSIGEILRDAEAGRLDRIFARTASPTTSSTPLADARRHIAATAELQDRLNAESEIPNPKSEI